VPGWLFFLPGVVAAPLAIQSNFLLVYSYLLYLISFVSSSLLIGIETNVIIKDTSFIIIVAVLTLILINYISQAYRFRFIFMMESMPVTIILCSLEGKIHYSNIPLPGTDESFHGKNIFYFATESEQDRLKSFMNEAIANKKIINYEVNPAQNNTRRYLNIYLVPISHFGQVDQFMFIIQDVHEKKMVELDLIEAKEEAEKASKVKSQFMAKMSHEIRTPLNSIIGLSDLLLHTELDTLQNKYMRNIAISSRHLLDLVNDVLDFSKIQSGKIELHKSIFEFKSSMEEIIKSFSESAKKKNISLTCNFESKHPVCIDGDLSKIRQILINLIGNAINFTENGGSVQLSVRSISHSDSNKLFYILDVMDTGIGIPENKVPYLFKEFSQITSTGYKKSGGTGLGLAISKNLAELMDGKITYTPVENGQGSIFSLILPLSIAQEKLEKNPEGEMNIITKSLYNNKLKILIVDDNEFNLIVLGAMLKNLNLDCDEVMDGEAALEKVRLKFYDVIFMDIELPGMDGIETLHEIQRIEKYKNSNFYSIACTAHTIEGSREKYISNGFDNYLPKPIIPEDFKSIISTIQLRLFKLDSSPDKIRN
jgi:PAS domain S-box-containing protein